MILLTLILTGPAMGVPQAGNKDCADWIQDDHLTVIVLNVTQSLFYCSVTHERSLLLDQSCPCCVTVLRPDTQVKRAQNVAPVCEARKSQAMCFMPESLA